MSGLDKKRIRNQTICFRASSEERRQIEARILVSGLPKGQFYLQSTINQEINIVAGKYQSDRLSLEIRKLRERIDKISIEDRNALYEPLMQCKALLMELTELMKKEKPQDVNEVNEKK